MSQKNIDELVTMAKEVTKQAAASGDALSTTPEMMDAIQSVAAKIKRSAGADSDLAALVQQIEALAKQTETK